MQTSTRGAQRRYEIKDANGKIVAVHVRQDGSDGEKRVWWERPNGKPGLNGARLADLPLYGAERVADWPEDHPIVLVEGEKATDVLLDAGIKALGTVTGAASEPGDDALEVLRDREAILWPDADKAGRSHMQRIAHRLQGIAEILRWYDDPDAADGEDAADHPAIVPGGDRERGMLLNDLLCAREWKPQPERNGHNKTGTGTGEDEGDLDGGANKQRFKLAKEALSLGAEPKDVLRDVSDGTQDLKALALSVRRYCRRDDEPLERWYEPVMQAMDAVLGERGQS